MRWIIALSIAAIIGFLAWWFAPNLTENKIEDPYRLLNDEVWMVIELRDTADLSLLNDSNSVLYTLLSQQNWPSLNSIKLGSRMLVFAFNASDFGIISSNELSGPLSDQLPNHLALGSWHVYTSATFDTEAAPFERKLTFQEDLSATQLSIKADRLLSVYATEFSEPLIALMQKEGSDDMWIQFEVRDDGAVFHASGIAQTSFKAIQHRNDLRLLRHIPSKTGFALISNIDSLNFAFAHVAYLNADDPFANLFVLYEHEKELGEAMNPDQVYQNIPIAIEPCPSLLSFLSIPWSNAAYSAQIGDIKVLAGSLDALVRWIDDYLADDKLINSSYYTQIESGISDAGFTLYIRPDALVADNPFLSGDVQWPSTNSLVFQAFSELPGQKFFSLSMLHHSEIIDEAPMVWSVVLDTHVMNGPWAFENHYNHEAEVLVQDAKHQLYLINKNGKTLWKKNLKASIQGDVQLIDAYQNGKFQMLLATTNEVYIIDRNGNDVEGFPVALHSGAQTGACAVRYSSKDELRIFVADGHKLLNLDLSGKEVKGWKRPEMESGLSKPVRYFAYSGKDYLMCMLDNGVVHLYDRQGKDRQKPLDMGEGLTSADFLLGKSLASCALFGCDSTGNLVQSTFNGKNETKNILPVGGQTGLLVAQDPSHQVISIHKDRVVTLNAESDVTLDYLLPEEVQAELQWISNAKQWIGLQAQASGHYYVMDLDGHMLDKMPLRGRGPAILLDLDGNGGMELVLSDGKRELRGYSLAD
jgi:hypothetical protein